MIYRPPIDKSQTKLCFVYCGDDYCDCGANHRLFPVAIAQEELQLEKNEQPEVKDDK